MIVDYLSQYLDIVRGYLELTYPRKAKVGSEPVVVCKH